MNVREPHYMVAKDLIRLQDVVRAAFVMHGSGVRVSPAAPVPIFRRSHSFPNSTATSSQQKIFCA